jgi:hypothetical protein
VTVSYLQSSKKGETWQDDIPGDQLSEDFDFCRYDTVPRSLPADAERYQKPAGGCLPVDALV